MKARVTKNILGIFAFDEKDSLVARELFSGKPEEIAEKLDSEVEKKFAERLAGYEIVSGVAGVEKILESLGYSRQKYNALLHEASLALARRKLGEVSQEKDREVMQAIEALNDLDEALNLLSERIREWYYLHSSEAIEDNRKIIDSLRTGEGVTSNFAEKIHGLYEFREKLERYIASTVEEIAPNTASLIGATLAARLISLAGGLQNLARMPGSRIQVLGAKKALFRHIKSHALPPKHGVIFQHPLIKSSPWWHRGKIARSLANKVAIAARVDAFFGESIGERLKEDFSNRVEEIRKKYPREPKKMRIIPYKPERKKRRKR